MSVAWIMSRHIITVGMDDQVRDARALLDQARVHHLAVLDGGELVGILSDRDLLNATSPYCDTKYEHKRDGFLLDRRVHQIMTRHPVTVAPHTAVNEAAAVMLLRKVSCLPVVGDDGAVCGIVTWRDLLRYFMANAIQHGDHAA
ncbi:MAG: CBS domain-containing protein [Nitrospirae bacterium]|nr:CBS domain-containing protein [Nitrospirota bacterium]